MKNIKTYILLFIILIIIIIGLNIIKNSINNKEHKLIGSIEKVDNNIIQVLTKDNIKYQFNNNTKIEIKKRDNVEIIYKGSLSKTDINDMIKISILKTTSSFLDNINQNGIFSAFYDLAQEKLNSLSLSEKIGQLLLVRVPDTDATTVIKNYNISGFVMFEKDFKDKTGAEIRNEINEFQNNSSIPLLIATDEEGGEVVRVSSNSKLIDYPFSSSQTLYKQGGFDLIKDDTIEKSKFLSSLGINVNLAPVADVSTTPTDYMYKRSFGQNTELTSEYVETVINASKGEDVSYVLKHFPGYGNNADTHTGTVIDSRPYDDIIKNDIPPFKAGIEAMAEAVLVSHNIVTNIEADIPATLSKKAHDLLRNELHFDGVIISDDMDMTAITNGNYQNVYSKAIDAGNDLLIVTNYEDAFNDIKNAIDNNTLSEDKLNLAVFRVLSWKYYKLLFPEK